MCACQICIPRESSAPAVVLTPQVVMPKAAEGLIPPVWFQWYVDQRIAEITGIEIKSEE